MIAGSARGRKLVAPDGDTVRPTKDIVKEAVFSALDARGALVDMAVLDLFAGTGALAIEALSRGAERAVLVERERTALAAIAQNVETLGFGDRVRVIASDVATTLRAPQPPEAPFDLVFVDPPYGMDDADVTAVLAGLDAPGWLADDAIVSVERPARHHIVAPTRVANRLGPEFGDTLDVPVCWSH